MIRALAVVAVLGSTASADPRNDAIETQPLAVIAHGMSLGYEHRIATKWSLVGIVGLRSAALGDYTSTTWDGGVELRRWKRTRIDGPYAALHVDAGRTTLAMSATDQALGSSWGFEQRIDFGWGFAMRDRVEITPSLGLGAHVDVDRVLGASMHPVIGIGLAVGFLF